MCSTVLVGHILRRLVDDDLPRRVTIGGSVECFDSRLRATILHELDKSNAWSAGARILSETGVV